MKKPSEGKPPQTDELTKRAEIRRILAFAIWKRDGSLVPEALRAQFADLMTESRWNPEFLSNAIDTTSRIRNREDTKFREGLIGKQPATVRDSDALNELLQMLELGKVAEIDHWFDQRASQCKAYWKRQLGISGGRRPDRQTLRQYAEWAWLNEQGLTPQQIAMRCCPGARKATDRVRKGLKAHQQALERLFGISGGKNPLPD
jgi:hypothetical protein